MGSDYGSSDLATLAASNRAHATLDYDFPLSYHGDRLRFAKIPQPIQCIDMKLFLVVPLGVLGVGPEKDREFCCWALSIALHGYAWPAGDLLVLWSPSLRVSRTSSCPRTVQPNMLLPPLEDIIWPLTESEGPF